MSNLNASRRKFLKLSATGVVAAVVAGVGGYFMFQTQTSPSPPMRPATSPIPTMSVSPSTMKPTPALLEEAKKEGLVMLYVTWSDDDIKPLKEAFEKRYGGVALETWRGGGGDFVSRMLTEHRANKRVMDVGIGATPVLSALDVGIVEKYISPEDNMFQPEHRHPEGLWTAFYASTIVVAYNTQRVKGEDIPKTYWDLLKPRFKDRISMYDPRGAPQIPITMKKKIIGEARYAEFMKGLLTQNVKIVGGSGPNISMLKSGEAEVALWLFTGSTLGAMREGTPIDFVRRKGMLIGSVGVTWVHKFAPHPNAARLLKDWLLSEEAQRMFADRGKDVMLRRGIRSKVGAGIGTGEEITSEMVDIVWPYTEKELNDAIAEFKKLMELP